MNRLLLQIIFSVATFFTSATAISQPALPSTDVIEKRNAAAVFVVGREMFALSLVRECAALLDRAIPNTLLIMTAWSERNSLELEASKVWLSEYFSGLQKQNPSSAQIAQQAFLQETSRALIESTRTIFRQKLPDEASCKRAVDPFSEVDLDLSNVGKQPRFEKFAEFAQTLKEYRSSAGYQTPSTRRFGYTPAQLAAGQMVASHDAAEAAQKSRDTATYLAAYSNMARQGDGKAAQTLGISYLNGDLLPKDTQLSYRWFYAAFQLGDYEGANAIGVMHRDGLITKGNDRAIAQASFVLAVAAARTNEARNRALNNFNRLDSALSNEEKSAVGCMSLSTLDDAYRTATENAQPLVQGASIKDPQRKIRDAIPPNFSKYRAESPC